MIDYTKLRKRLKENNITQSELAELLNISKSGLSMRFKRGSYFTLYEVLKIKTILNMNEFEIAEELFGLDLQQGVEEIKEELREECKQEVYYQFQERFLG